MNPTGWRHMRDVLFYRLSYAEFDPLRPNSRRIDFRLSVPQECAVRQPRGLVSAEFPRVSESFADRLHRELALGALEAVEVEQPVEVVALVLDAYSQKTFGFQLEWLAVTVQRLDANT